MSIKCLLNQPLRQALGMVQSLLQRTLLDGPVPDFSTVFRRQKNLRLQLSFIPSMQPRNLLVDSTVIKFLAEGQFNARNTDRSTAALGARVTSE